MNRREFVSAGAATLAASTVTPAIALASGFTDTGIDALTAAMAAEVEAGKLPGLTWLIAKGDDVRFGAAGSFDTEGTAPMARDTIFRIASVTKPMVAACVMMLVEEGKLALDEPVDRLLPELANRQVLTALNAPLDSTVPAARPITVRDLLTNTLGFGTQFDPSLPIEQAVAENQLVTGYNIPPTPYGPDEWLRRLGTLPLMAQPGETWLYNVGSIVQGILIARASGQSLETFMQERLLAPLGMVDTGFMVPAEKLHRVPTAYGFDFATNQPTVDDRPDGIWSRPQALPHGGGGLVSTVDDVLAFARLMQNGGVHNGTRLLSEATVAEMTRDQLTPGQKAMGAFGMADFFSAMSWGYGMSVSTGPLPWAPNAGRYGWDGGFGTSWANDPKTGLIGIFMSQSVGYYVMAGQFAGFWSGAYASLA